MTAIRNWPMWLCMVAMPVLGQNAPGGVSVRVTDPEGGFFSGAFVQLNNPQTAAVLKAASAAAGRYTFPQVEPGTYELSVNVPGMKPYHRTGIMVAPGKSVELDARLEDSVSLRTLGEDPETIAALYINRPPPPAGPAARTLDGKPDLSGMWLGGPAQHPQLHMLPWAEALTKERTGNNFKDLPLSRCLPSGPVPLMASGFFKLVQTPALVILMFEDETPGYRQVFLDGRAHPNNFGPTWLGHSTGTWEGDTLVVDSIGFNDRGWLDLEGRPHSDRLHVIQRFRRKDRGHLEMEITIDDPGAFSEPWTAKKTATLDPSEEIQEYICNENNKDVEHLVGK